MLERIIVVLVVLVTSTAVYRGFGRMLVTRARTRVMNDPLLQSLRPNTPTVVYFTTPMCIPCQTQQQPALMRLQAEFGDTVQIIRIDATEDPETADRWGVFSVPTTFILDRTGQPQQVNYGVADTTRLRRQLDNVMVKL